MYAETFFQEDNGTKRYLQESIKDHPLYNENDDYWKMVIIYSIRNSINDEEESSEADETFSSMSLPFTHEDIAK